MCLTVAYSLAYSQNQLRNIGIDPYLPSYLPSTFYLFMSIINVFQELFGKATIIQKLYLLMNRDTLNDLERNFNSNETFREILAHTSSKVYLQLASDISSDSDSYFAYFFDTIDIQLNTPLDITFTNVRAASVISICDIDSSVSVSSIVSKVSKQGDGTVIITAINSIYSTTMLWCHTKNKSALDFYKKNGYTIIDNKIEIEIVEKTHRALCISSEELAHYIMLKN